MMTGKPHRRRLAIALMVMITLVNVGLAANLAFAGATVTALGVNGQNIYTLAIPEMLLVLMAYVLATHTRTPVHTRS